MTLREARFCQDGHKLVKLCFFCHKEFAVDHQLCDFCGELFVDLQIGQVFQGTVRSIEDYYAWLEILSGITTVWLDASEIANHPISSIYGELQIGEQIDVKILRIEKGIVYVSAKALGRP